MRHAAVKFGSGAPVFENEKDFLGQLVGAAKKLGWLAYHTHDSRCSEPGFPDVVLVRPPRVVFVELKTQQGAVMPEQLRWLAVLAQCPGVETHLWRPSDWDRALAILAARGPASLKGGA